MRCDTRDSLAPVVGIDRVAADLMLTWSRYRARKFENREHYGSIAEQRKYHARLTSSPLPLNEKRCIATKCTSESSEIISESREIKRESNHVHLITVSGQIQH